MPADASFPVFDLARFEAGSPGEKRALGAEVDAICRTTGFLAVAGHGVPDATVEAAWTKAEAFFALPPERKQSAKAPYPGYPYGYLGPETELLARSRGVAAPPDIKESFNGGPARAPGGPRRSRGARLLLRPDHLARRSGWLPRGLAGVLCGDGRSRGADHARFRGRARTARGFLCPFLSAPVSALRALNYPALAAPPKPGQIRAGAHTDYGSLTILLPQAGSRGLEILGPDGAWIEVPPRPGAFVVNIGDLMARWTNDRWTSTLHRVVIPDDGGAERRQSFAFFHQPNWDAEIVALDACLAANEAPKYPPVRSGPYLMGKFKSTTM